MSKVESVLYRNVTGRIMGNVGKTKKDGYICNLLINGDSTMPEVIKIHSKSADSFLPDPVTGLLTISVQFQDFCFAV